MSCDPVVPELTQEQKKEFIKLTVDFLAKYNFPNETISEIEIEIKFNPSISEEVIKNSIVLNMGGCRRGTPQPDDPCFLLGKVWAGS